MVAEPNLDTMSFSLSPLAKEWPGRVASYEAPATIKRRGITVISPQQTSAPFAVTEVPFQDGFTVYWDRPDFNSKNVRPRYDGMAHLIPKGAGRPIRKSK